MFLINAITNLMKRPWPNNIKYCVQKDIHYKYANLQNTQQNRIICNAKVVEKDTLKLNSHLMRHDAARHVTVRQKQMLCVHI